MCTIILRDFGYIFKYSVSKKFGKMLKIIYLVNYIICYYKLNLLVFSQL